MSDARRVRPGGPVSEAAEWQERLAAQPHTPELHEAFQRWRDANPANARAHAEIEHVVATARAARDSEAGMALRRETAARVARRSAFRWPGAAMAASLAVAVALGSFGLWRLYESTTVETSGPFATRAGERMTVTLSDGSIITLNTRSRVRARYSRYERRLYLEAGETLFEVAKDPRRPFVVLAAGQSITARGTTFDVYIREKDLEVVLTEGVVEVKPEGVARANETRMSPGQKLTVADGTATLTQVRSTEAVASWRKGFVVFDDTTLGEAVAEMNRYSSRPIRLADRSLEGLRLSGSFRTDGGEAFVEAVTLYFPVRALRDDASIVIAPASNG